MRKLLQQYENMNNILTTAIYFSADVCQTTTNNML